MHPKKSVDDHGYTEDICLSLQRSAREGCFFFKKTKTKSFEQWQNTLLVKSLAAEQYFA